MFFLRSLLVISFLFLSVSVSLGQGNSDRGNSKLSIFDLMYYGNEETSKLMIVADLDTLLAEGTLELPAKIRFNTKSGDAEIWDLKLEIRGAFRRLTCDVPPLKLNFAKKQLKDRGLYKYDNIKLVTHCLDAEESTENILKEWAVYQMYESLSDMSFRTQLIEVEYKDNNSSKSISNLGILIESIDQLRKRKGFKECNNCMGLIEDHFHLEDLLRVSLFQYMIGNTDWSPHFGKNLKMLGKVDSTVGLIPVPYDFDFSYLVGPSYAKPRVQIGQTSLKQRIYLGPPMTKEACQPVFALFQEKKEEFKSIIENTAGISRSSKDEMLKYLKSFYKELDKGKVLKEVLNAPPLDDLRF